MEIKIGTRGSKLALIQANFIKSALKTLFDKIHITLTPFDTPGDRDKNTPLEILQQDDFFTCDLDYAVLDGSIDLAVHSAKDLPNYEYKNIDWFFWPDPEDRRDVIVMPENKTKEHSKKIKTIGISSQRRKLYAEKHFPKASIKPIRGNIENRLGQLDSGKYDLLILAAAGLKRLKLEHRISKYIPLSDLLPPEGQGYLAITFKKNNSLMILLRSLLLCPVKFIGAGPGNPEYLTNIAKEEIQNCEVCLYDGLVPSAITDLIKDNSIKMSVSKRKGKTVTTPSQIGDLLIKHYRKNKKVIRLKGGDPGIFARLKEELNALSESNIPYLLVPGLSSPQALLSSGYFLTERTRNQHLIFSTAIKENGTFSFLKDKTFSHENTSHVIFMGIDKRNDIIKKLMENGYPDETPLVVASKLSTPYETKWEGSLKDLLKCKKNFEKPGVLIIGKGIDQRSISPYAPLLGKKILLTGTDFINFKAKSRCRDYGALAINCPMFKPSLNRDSLSIVKEIKNFDYIILFSPTGVHLFFEALKEFNIDIRSIPSLIATGENTAKELKKHGFQNILFPKIGSLEYLLNLLEQIDLNNKKILLPRSQLAGHDLEKKLKQKGASPVRLDLYIQEKTEIIIPPFDAVVFFSSSQVERFHELKKEQPFNLIQKKVAVIGKPTALTFNKYFNRNCIISSEPDASGVINALAVEFLKERINSLNL